MSRSKKKHAIVKDHTGRWYNKVIRRRQNQEVKEIITLADILEYKISHPNEIVDKYDISDWKFIYDKTYATAEEISKVKRK